MVVTIDGPAGSGKSTAARKLAARLEIPYIDTGAMYRAVAYAALHRNVDLTDEQALVEMARSLKLKLDCGPTHTRVRVDGHDVSEAIRTMEVSAATSAVARCQAMRAFLVDRQRALGESLGSFITEGRDQGSVVFPDADVKFVLLASLERRAERRHREMCADGEDVRIESVMQGLRVRDGVDSEQWEPLLTGSRAVVIDTTDVPIAELVERMADVVMSRSPQAGSPPR